MRWIACVLLTGIAWARPIPAGYLSACGTLDEAGPWDVSSEPHLLAYPPAALKDRTYETCWATPQGPGSWFAVTPRLKSATFYTNGFYIANGFTRSNQDFLRNSRIREANLELDGLTVARVRMLDQKDTQEVKLPRVIAIRPGQTLRIRILSVYPGTRYDDCCVSEFALLNGRH